MFYLRCKVVAQHTNPDRVADFNHILPSLVEPQDFLLVRLRQNLARVT